MIRWQVLQPGEPMLTSRKPDNETAGHLSIPSQQVAQ